MLRCTLLSHKFVTNFYSTGNEISAFPHRYKLLFNVEKNIASRMQQELRVSENEATCIQFTDDYISYLKVTTTFSKGKLLNFSP